MLPRRSKEGTGCMIARLKEFLRMSFQASLVVQSALGSWKRGYWQVIPLSVIGTIFVIIMASDLAKSSHVACQVVMYVLFVLNGAALFWHGTKQLARAEMQLGRALRWHEKVVDVSLGAKPFTSLFYLQLRTWGVLIAVLPFFMKFAARPH